MNCWKCKKNVDHDDKVFCEGCYAIQNIIIAKNFKKEVKKKLFMACEVCGITDKNLLTIDHIESLESGGARFDIENIQWLCYNHHKLKTIGKIKPNRHKRKRNPLEDAIEVGLTMLGGVDGVGGL